MAEVLYAHWEEIPQTTSSRTYTTSSVAQALPVILTQGANVLNISQGETATQPTEETKVEKPSVSVEDMKDIPSDAWYADDVAYMMEKGWMTGTDSDAFSPDLSTERGMVITILYRMEGSPAASGTSQFPDVKDGEWYTNAILWGTGNNIARGYDDGNFYPNKTVSRQELACFIYRYAQFKGYDTDETVNLLLQFVDANEIAAWAKDAMEWSNAATLIQGTSNDTLAPEDSTARSQLAAICHRFGVKYVD